MWLPELPNEPEVLFLLAASNSPCSISDLSRSCYFQRGYQEEVFIYILLAVHHVVQPKTTYCKQTMRGKARPRLATTMHKALVNAT